MSEQNTRQVSKEESDIIDELFRRKTPYNAETRRWEDLGPTHAYVTSTVPLTLRKWHGHDNAAEAIFVSPESTLKIVMISGMGDFGLTDDLDAERGYHLRLPINSDKIKNIRFTP